MNIEDLKKSNIITQSIRAATYIVYQTNIYPKVEMLDRGNTFIFPKDDEVIYSLKKYKKSQFYKDDTLMVDINYFDEICKKLKRMCAELKA